MSVNNELNRLTSFRTGFVVPIGGTLPTILIFWSLATKDPSKVEYWVRDFMLMFATFFQTCLAVAATIMIAKLKVRSDEITKIPLAAIIALGLPLPIVLAGAFAEKQWWMCILPYATFLASVIGANVCSLRITNLKP